MAQTPRNTWSLTTMTMASAFALALAGCFSTDNKKEDGPGTIEFRIQGEDIPYHNLLGEDDLGYVYADSATIEYAYMIVRSPKLNPAGHGHHHSLAKTGATLHSGVNLPGFFAVDLLQGATLGTVEGVDPGNYGINPEITIYPANASERAGDNMTDFNEALAQIPEGYSFRFGGMLYMKDTAVGAVRYEVRQNVAGIVSIEEFPPDGGDGTPLVVRPGKTLVASFHPHIDHALEVLADENQLDWASLEMSGDTVVFSPATNNLVLVGSDSVNIYQALEGKIKQGDHWDVNVIPD